MPLGLKIVYTLFVCVLVPIYWSQYGPANFLWFSDIALLAMVPALWLENALIASTMAVSIIFFEAIWNIDFFTRLATGKSLIGLSAYMFDPKIPLFVRALSCFHIGLPVLILWALHRLGYRLSDVRVVFHLALRHQAGIALFGLPVELIDEVLVRRADGGRDGAVLQRLKLWPAPRLGRRGPGATVPKRAKPCEVGHTWCLHEMETSRTGARPSAAPTCRKIGGKLRAGWRHKWGRLRRFVAGTGE